MLCEEESVWLKTQALMCGAATFVVLYEYIAQEPDELTIEPGKTVYVVETSADG